MILKQQLSVGLCFLSLLSTQLKAEGMIDFEPYVRAGVMFDDNLLRFASKAEAEAAGFSTQSDRLNTLDVGGRLNLRISRQMVRVTASLNDNKYNRNAFLDNTGKSYGIAWDWRIGDDVFGDLSTGSSQSIVGFSDNDLILRNLRTFKNQRASINWRPLTSWTIYGVAENSDLENDELSFLALDREDNSYELGTRYLTTSGTQVGLFYRYLTSDYVNRTGNTSLIFGRKNNQNQFGLNLAWTPTLKSRFSGQISTIRFIREDAIQNDFNGLSQRWNFDYALSGKTSLGLTAYRELTSVDDLLSTYVLFKGAGATANWNLTNKLNISSSYSIGKREFLGGSSVFSLPLEREDETKRFGFNVAYLPTEYASLQLRYLDEDRTSNILNQGYQFQSIQLIGQYTF